MWTLLSVCWGGILGVAVQLQQAQLWGWGAYAGCGLVGVWVLCGHVKTRPVLRNALLALACALLSFAQTGWRAALYQQQALNPALEGQSLQVQGVISALPDLEAGHWRFRFEVDSSANVVNVPSSLLLNWYANEDPRLSPPTLKVGQRWRFFVRLKVPHGSINPHGFDTELWMWQQGLQASGYVRHNKQEPEPVLLGNSAAYPVQALRQRVRDTIESRIEDRSAAGIVSALTLGDQAAIDRSDWQVFRATGVAHLMSISGLHITGLAWVVAVCVGFMWRRSDAWQPHNPWALRCPTVDVAYAAACVSALLYAVFTGWGVPAQRTVLMLVLFILLRWHDKRWPWFYNWSVVAWLVVMCDPWALLQAGFWLSFVAVALLFASGRDVWPRQTPSLLRQTLSLFKEQWLMSVCLAPLSLVLFHQVSLVGFAANVLAVPWITLWVTPLCLLGLIVPQAWSFAAWSVQVSQTLLADLSAWPLAQWSGAAAPAWAGVAAVLGLSLWALRLPWWLRLLGLVWVLPLITWQVLRPEAGEFDLLAADMGQGHAVLLRTASHSLLYDTGPRYSAQSDAGQRVLVPLLQSLGERLTRIVVSHQDADHSGGLAAVLATQPQAQVWTSVAREHPLRSLGVMHTCEAGQRWQWDGVYFEVLHPTSDDYQKKLPSNALSCVLRVQSASGRTALLVGDIEAKQELELLARQATAATDLQADWLLVPHHGSATSSTQPFLQAVRPQIAVVQAGYRNRFGHPRADVVARYEALAVHLVQTPQCGATFWQSQQPELVQCERAKQKNYWNHQF